MKMGVGEFKARCLRLIDEIHLDGTEIVLTKRGRPLVRVVPLRSDEWKPAAPELARLLEIRRDLP